MILRSGTLITSLVIVMLAFNTGAASAQSGSQAVDCDGRTATVIGTSGDDVLYGTAGADVIVGLGGDDVIYARGGDDIVCGGEGRDRIYGDDGDDVVHAGAAIDYVWGGSGADTLIGNGGSDRLRGGGGSDLIVGGSGADRLWGGDGNDEILGQGGQDEIWGGPGNDTLQGNWQSDTIWGEGGSDVIRGAGGKDVLYGGQDRDRVWGGDNSDVLFGGSGWDRLFGNRGADELWGGSGSDRLYGGPHTDVCHRGSDGLLSSCQQRSWELSDRWELTEFSIGTGWQPVGLEPWLVPVIELDASTGRGTIDIPGSDGCTRTSFDFVADGATWSTSGWPDSRNCSGPRAWVIDAISQADTVKFSASTVTFAGSSALRFARVGNDYYRSYDIQQTETALAQAKASWTASVAARGESYQMVYRISCFGCNLADRRAIVENGSATFVIEAGPYPTFAFEEQTVPSLFALIEQALELDAYQIDVTYGDHGVPERVYVDFSRFVRDDETSYSVSSFAFSGPN